MTHAALNIAVIGSGISGLSCAWLLNQNHQVTLFEKDDRFGGHSNTLTVAGQDGPIDVDTGFIVFNPTSYPNLVALFDYLGIPVIPTEMSFSVSLDEGRLEYAGTDLNGLFGQRSNLLRPRFWRMVLDILRFYRESPALLDTVPDTLSLGELLQQHGYGEAFREEHLLPMGAAIWSTPRDKMLDFPAKSFLRFCHNHGLLQVSDRPQWHTVKGGSRVYVNRLLATLGEGALANRGARSVRRQVMGGKTQVIVTDWQGQAHWFDHVVLACHADQALKLLGDADEQERQLLGAFRFERNRTLLHSDERLMPRRRRVWSSWNYLRQSADNPQLAVTYWMNRLQHLPASTPLFVTLNPYQEPDPDKVHAAFLYDHPLFDLHALQAQQQLWSLQGVQHTWFCGAWFGYGFHEDGLQSGLAVAEALGGQDRPWQVDGMYDRLHLPLDWRRRGQHPEAA
ncbi:NAD(P)/FAD-dependent oxidoreductase [Motiliproteus sp. SC1-56]|uniref:NAD(P)/FAD-dependent oxidoreductase n=1 Tax=Motiliproteus sp. SC1-56 TaxID=2799565 RepID=UPI001A8F544B|nr:FAD-dependent oxidoreductase [Motiliproteus sp. SC1-56]